LYNLALAERKDAYLRGEGIGYGVEQNGLVLLQKHTLGFVWFIASFADGA
jgi:hypothetical protein